MVYFSGLKKLNIKLRTYNCNCLGKLDKLRRVFKKVHQEVNKGGIVLLQETHVKDESIISMYWKMKYILCTFCIPGINPSFVGGQHCLVVSISVFHQLCPRVEGSNPGLSFFLL